MIEIPSPAFFFFLPKLWYHLISIIPQILDVRDGSSSNRGKMHTNVFYSYNCDRENSHGGKLQAMGVHGQSCITQLPVAMTLNG